MFNLRKCAPLLVVVVTACSSGQVTLTPPPPVKPILVDEKTPGCSGDNCDTLLLKFPELPGYIKKDVRTQIEAAIDTIMLAKFLEEGAVKDVDQFKANYFELVRSAHERGGESIPWEVRRVARNLFANQSVLTIMIENDEFTGGAHGLSTKTLLSFDLRDGHRLLFSEVTDPARAQLLSTIGDFEFRKVRDVAPGRSLADAGFTFTGDKFAYNDNFGILASSIVFHFDPYEIAPYYFGPTDLQLSSTALLAVLNRSSPAVRHLLQPEQQQPLSGPSAGVPQGTTH